MKGIIKRIIAGLLIISLITVVGCKSKDQATDATTETEATTTVTTEATNTTPVTLRQWADTHNLLIGAAVEPDQLDEADFAKTLSTEFNFVTPENRMKWGFIHPEQNTYNFEGADKIVAFANENNMKVRGHTLVWHIENPDWLTKGTWTKEELKAVLKDHIQTVVGHYKGQVYSWDVVNEPVDLKTYRDTLWYQIIGEEYIEDALTWAHEADPDAKLYINDYAMEEINLKSDTLYDLVKSLKEKGVPLDGVGFQFHIDLDNPPDMISVYANLKRFLDLGLAVDFTEIDVRINGEVTEAQLAKQAELYKQLAEFAVYFDGVEAYTTWGLTDKYSWVPTSYTDSGAALVFDQNYVQKPAYTGILSVLSSDKVELTYEEQLANLAGSRTPLKPYGAIKLENAPTLDGKISDGEWDNAITYSFAYNQMNLLDQTITTDEKDIDGTWRLGYKDNILYGVATRQDDITVADHELNYENDCLELFIDYQDVFNQIRTIIGADFEENSMESTKSVWNSDGTVVEFAVALPEEDLTGLVIGFNIALADNDDKALTRKYQLYPTPGTNSCWQGMDLTNLKFLGDTPRPTDMIGVPQPFNVSSAASAPTIDGKVDADEWSLGIIYPFAFDQLDPLDQTVPGSNDLTGKWIMMWSENKLYGAVLRRDDVTVQDAATEAENDSVDLYFKVGDETILLHTTVGGELKDDTGASVGTASWSPDGSVLEYQIDLTNAFAEGDIRTFSITLTDNDGDGVVNKLYPFYGNLESPEEGNVGELIFN